MTSLERISDYRMEVRTTRPLPTMDVLLDAVEAWMRQHGFHDGEWEATVHGPPELHFWFSERPL